jgi:hypothetical protein
VLASAHCETEKMLAAARNEIAATPLCLHLSASRGKEKSAFGIEKTCNFNDYAL